MGSSAGIFLGTFPNGVTTGELNGDWVDVRDAAEQHVLALKTSAAGGERILATNGMGHNEFLRSFCRFSNSSETFQTAGIYAWQDLYDVLHDAGFKGVPGKETYGAGKNKATAPICVNTKSLKIYPDFKYRTLSESVVDMANEFVKDGFM